MVHCSRRLRPLRRADYRPRTMVETGWQDELLCPLCGNPRRSRETALGGRKWLEEQLTSTATWTRCRTYGHQPANTRRYERRSPPRTADRTKEARRLSLHARDGAFMEGEVWRKDHRDFEGRQRGGPEDNRTGQQAGEEARLGCRL